MAACVVAPTRPACNVTSDLLHVSSCALFPVEMIELMIYLSSPISAKQRPCDRRQFRIAAELLALQQPKTAPPLLLLALIADLAGKLVTEAKTE